MPKIAITGATGFVGGFVADYLESHGYEVIRFGRRNMEKVIRWDIESGSYPESLMVDCVVHCAANVDDWARYVESFSANVTGTRNVLQSFSNVSQFIYISSASVYDAFCKQVVIRETDCLGGRMLNAYSQTKLMGEKEVEKSDIISRIILRPHIIYGKGDTTIAPRIRRAIESGYFPVPGNGKNRISFTHVENLAQAILKSIEKSKKGFSIYNITDSEHTTLSQALDMVRELNHLDFKKIFISRSMCLFIGTLLEFIYRIFRIKKSPLLTRYIVDQMSSDHILDISKAREELGYEPKRDIEHDFMI